MIGIRLSRDRGHFDHGWLKTYHTFSFAEYQDPRYMGFRNLRVINEDTVEPAQGFGTHSHRDMEIVTYVLQGTLEHKDSMGNGSLLKYGDVQRMSAGTGVTHSEFNHSKTENVHLFQIWILPEKRGITPSYEQKVFSEKDKENKLKLVASNTGEQGSVTVHQDVKLYATILKKGVGLEYSVKKGRSLWLQAARGEIFLNDSLLQAGDGAAVIDEDSIRLKASNDCEALLFDLA